MSLLANSLSEELEYPHHSVAPSPTATGSGNRRHIVSEKNKIIAASTGAVVTSLTMTPFDVIKTRLQTQAPPEPLFAPSSSLPPPSVRSTSPWPPPIASTSAIPSSVFTSSSSSATNLATCCQKTYFSSNAANAALLCNFDPRTATLSLPGSGAHFSATRPHPPTSFTILPSIPTLSHTTTPSPTCIYPSSGAAALALPTSSLPSSSRHLSGFWDAVIKIVRHEGLKAMWRGTGPGLVMSVPGQVVYMIGYDWGRRTAFAHPPAWARDTSSPSSNSYPGLRPTSDAADPPRLKSSYLTLVPLLAGSASRTFVAALVSPIELVRTRLQSSTTGTTVPAIIRALAAEGGIANAWRGLPPTLWRDVPFSGVYWAGYEGIKRALTGGKGMGEGWEDDGVWEEFGIAFVSGAGSGMIAATLTNPFDVVKTRRQALDTPRPSSLSSASPAVVGPTKTFAIIADIARKEGPAALFKGLTPRLAKVGPACGIMVGCYEGLGSGLPPQPHFRALKEKILPIFNASAISVSVARRTPAHRRDASPAQLVYGITNSLSATVNGTQAQILSILSKVDSIGVTAAVSQITAAEGTVSSLDISSVVPNRDQDLAWEISAVITILGDVVNGPVSDILSTVDGILNGVTTLVENLLCSLSLTLVLTGIFSQLGGVLRLVTSLTGSLGLNL